MIHIYVVYDLNCTMACPICYKKHVFERLDQKSYLSGQKRYNPMGYRPQHKLYIGYTSNVCRQVIICRLKRLEYQFLSAQAGNALKICST